MNAKFVRQPVLLSLIHIYMGLEPEEVEYLCDIASYGDYGHANALDLQGTWLCTSAKKGCEYCDFKIEKLKEKTIV